MQWAKARRDGSRTQRELARHRCDEIRNDLGEAVRGNGRFPVGEYGGVRSDLIGRQVEPDRQDYFGPVNLACGESLEFLLWPLLRHEVRAQHDDSEAGGDESAVDRPAETCPRP